MIASLVFLTCLAVTLVLIGKRVRQLVSNRNAVRLTCEMYYPVILAVVYGLAAVPLLYSVTADLPGYVGVEIKPSDVLFSFIIMILGALSYVVGFNFTYRLERQSRDIFRIGTAEREAAFTSGAVALAAVDVMVRLQQIMSGQYFDWMRGRAAELFGDGQNALWLLQDGLAPVLAAIATQRSQKQRIWMIYLFALLFALVLEGKRTKLLLAIAAALVVHFVLHKSHIRPARIFKFAILGAFGLSFASSAILEARIKFRGDINGALANPAEFLKDMVIEVAPKAAANVFTARELNTETIRGASFTERMPAWAITFASQTWRVEEIGVLPLASVFDEMAIVVPSVFWFGKKPTIGISTTIANYYNLWTPGSRSTSADLASTALVNPYLYFQLPGLIIYAAVLGALVGATAYFTVTRFGFNGMLIMIGSVYYLKPLSNSMAGPVVGLRNLIIVILFFYAIEVVRRTVMRSRTRTKRSLKN